MKTILVLALGMAPLAVLTASSLLGSGQAATATLRDEDEPAPDLAALKQLAKDGDEAAKREDKVAKKFASLEILSKSRAHFDANDAAGRCKNLAEAWGSLESAEQAAADLAGIYRAAPSPEAESTELTKYASVWSTKWDSLKGGESLKRHVEELQVVAGRRGKLVALLNTARGSFNAGKYKACLEQIKELNKESSEQLAPEGSTGSAAGLNSKERDELKKMSLKSEFRLYLENCETLYADARLGKDKAKAYELRELLKNPKQASDEDDSSALKMLQDKHSDLMRRIRIDELFAESQSLHELVVESNQILKDDSEAKSVLSEKMKEWLKRSIKQKKVYYKQELEETWDKDGKYLVGVFVQVPNPKDVNNTRWKYWDSWDVWNTKGQYTTDIYLSGLKQKPEKMAQVRISGEYNAAREKLFLNTNLGNKERWREFATQTRRLYDELEAYSKARNKALSLSLDAERKLAADAVEDWAAFERILNR